MTSHDPTRERLELAAGPARVLVLGVHPGDARAACRGSLEFHARRGDHVTLVDLAEDSGLGDERFPDASAAPLQAAPPGARSPGSARGSLGACTGLVARIQAVLAEAAPLVVYIPSALEPDPDRKAAACAAAAALASGPPRTVMIHAADAPLPAGAAIDFGTDARFVRLESRVLLDWQREMLAASQLAESARQPRTTAVVSTWNRREDVRANLDSLRAQTLPFHEIVVVDNASTDGTAEMIARDFPEVRLITMPHDRFGACTTFNIGFASSTTELTAILDDDIVMPPEWLEKATSRLVREPATTAIVSTQVVEPGMPEEYRNSPHVNEERYMSTFRGCASLARTQALREARFYDERLFLYGNERDLTCRLLNLGYRVLQYPGCGVFHKTPFGIKMGKRSLYFHARNAWLSMLKYAPLSDLVRMPWLVVTRVILRGERREAEGRVRDAVGTIGIGRALRETKGATWIVFKALLSVLWNVPYCLKHRQPVKSADFELPLS